MEAVCGLAPHIATSGLDSQPMPRLLELKLTKNTTELGLKRDEQELQNLKQENESITNGIQKHCYDIICIVLHLFCFPNFFNQR